MEVSVDVGQVFTQVYQHLNEGGRFIFDALDLPDYGVFPGYSYHENVETLCHGLGFLCGRTAPHSIVLS